jgi:hypothetical protein
MDSNGCKRFSMGGRGTGGAAGITHIQWAKNM